MSDTGIRPDFTLYELRVRPGSKNSPPEPSVDLYSVDLHTGRTLGGLDQLTPDQAREYARMILGAADAAER